MRKRLLSQPVHHLLLLSFILLALSGLAFFHPAFYPLVQLFGGGVWARILHPIIGWLMMIGFVLMYFRFKSLNKMEPADREWLDRVGEMMELDAIFAVVVGGTSLTGGRFTLIGSVVGALLIQTLTSTMYNFGVPPAVAPALKAIVILSVCLLQSEKFRQQLGGIFGRKAR